MSSRLGRAEPRDLPYKRENMAGWTGLEPATFCVTGRRSNQLSYHPVMGPKSKLPVDHPHGQEGIPQIQLKFFSLGPIGNPYPT
jgi:hypothetical protein